MSPILDALRAGRSTLADEARWTRGSYAPDANGNRAFPEDPKAVCFCAWGALIRQQDVPSHLDEVSGASLLRTAAAELFDRSPAMVNDGLGHAAVLRMYDRAIELAEAQS